MRRSIIFSFLLLLITTLLVQSTSAQSCTIQDNVNYDTTGDSVTLYNVSSASACCSACLQFDECQYWSWVKDSTSSTYKQCQIKNRNSLKISSSSSSTTSGVRSTVVAPRGGSSSSNVCGSQTVGIDYNNGFLSTAKASSLSACCALCNNYTGCNFYVYAGTDCYLKGSNSSVVSNSGTTAGSVVRPRTVPIRTGKRGIAWFNSHSCSDLKKLTDISWIYNWDVQPDAYLLQCIIDYGLEFIPMQRVAPLTLDKVYTGASRLLTFNEPNFASQANLSPSAAASYWPAIQKFANQNNMLISSPSASAGGDLMDPIQWFDQFFAACTNCQVDFITTHIYTCSPAGVNNFLQGFKKYNKPIWLTEFACPSAGATISQASTFLSQTLPYLENDAQFARYAWFGTRISPADGWLGYQVNLFDIASGALSDVGRVYSPSSSSTPATSAPGAPTTAPTTAPATARPATAAPTTAPTVKSTIAATTAGAAPTTAPTVKATIAATITGSTPGSTPASSYIGCYVDSATRDLPSAPYSSNANTVEKCLYYCGVRHYSYAGLQYGVECLCGNSYGSQGKAAESDCNMACSGNSKQMCGAGYRNSVYNSAQVGYIGCYSDNPGGSATRDLIQKTSANDTTIESCRQLCSSQNYLYTGLQYGKECWCGNTYGSFGKAAESDCNMACAGDSTETCGAGARNSIFTSQSAASYPGY